MQDVAYQEEIAVPDATGEEAIIPVENAMLDAENLPLDVRRNPPRHLQPPLRYGHYLSVGNLSCNWSDHLHLSQLFINTPVQV